MSLLLLSGIAAAQTDEEKAAARSLATQGGEALGLGKYAEALDLVARAEQIVHAPTHLLMIARAQAGMGRLVAAKETYLRLLREELAPSAPAAFKRAQAEGRGDLTALDPRIGQLRISLEGVGQTKVTVKMDEQPVSPALLGVYRPIDPGKHEVVAYPAGQSPVKGSVEVRDGERKELKLAIPDAPPLSGPGVDPNAAFQLSPPPPPPPVSGGTASPGFFTPLRGVGLGFAIAGAAGAVGGAIVIADGFSISSDADAKNNACEKICTPAQQLTIGQLDVQAARTKTVGIVVLSVSLGAAVVGGILLAVGKPSPRPTAAHVAPWVSGNVVGLEGSF